MTDAKYVACVMHAARRFFGWTIIMQDSGSRTIFDVKSTARRSVVFKISTMHFTKHQSECVGFRYQPCVAYNIWEEGIWVAKPQAQYFSHKPTYILTIFWGGEISENFNKFEKNCPKRHS